MYHKSEKYEKGFSNVGCVISGKLECTVYATDVSFNLFFVLFCFVFSVQYPSIHHIKQGNHGIITENYITHISYQERALLLTGVNQITSAC